MVAALDRPVAFQCDPVKQAAVPMIVVQRIVKRAPVVPDGAVADSPAEPALKLRQTLVPEEMGQQAGAFFFGPSVEPDGVTGTA